MNQVRHRFGLCEIDAAIEEGAFGELPGSASRAVLQQRVEHELGQRNPPQEISTTGLLRKRVAHA